MTYLGGEKVVEALLELYHIFQEDLHLSVLTLEPLHPPCKHTLLSLPNNETRGLFTFIVPANSQRPARQMNEAILGLSAPS